MSFSVYMVFHNEYHASCESLRSVLLKNRDVDDFIIARDSLPMENEEFFEEFAPTFLSQRNCMEGFYPLKKEKKTLKFRTIEDSLEIINCYVSRLEELASKARHENILCLEPDTKIRGRINFSSHVDMECLDVNKYSENLLTDVLRTAGKPLPISGWGFCVGLTNRTTLFEIASWLRSNQVKIQSLLKLDIKIENIDHGLPILAHLAGRNVSRSSQITEVNRNLMWRFNRKPILHQYRKHY